RRMRASSTNSARPSKKIPRQRPILSLRHPVPLPLLLRATRTPARPSRICSRSSCGMKSSRRSFLETGLALPAILEASPSFAPTSQPSESTSKDSSFDPWVEIHRENLRHNVQEISRRVASRPILAVVQNNGYPMRVPTDAQLLHPPPNIFVVA